MFIVDFILQKYDHNQSNSHLLVNLISNLASYLINYWLNKQKQVFASISCLFSRIAGLLVTTDSQVPNFHVYSLISATTLEETSMKHSKLNFVCKRAFSINIRFGFCGSVPLPSAADVLSWFLVYSTRFSKHNFHGSISILVDEHRIETI